MTKVSGQANILSQVDPAYAKLDPVATPMCFQVWNDKYRWGNETYDDMLMRVAQGVYAKDTKGSEMGLMNQAYHFMKAGLWMPAGRILTAAGTPKRVTMVNCFVNAKLEDDMESIADGVKYLMLTMQQGGGMGTDFSPLRPPFAVLNRTGSTASGPGKFIDMWDATCETIKSAGDRRGAMMGTLICTHPFLPEFIKAKHTKGVWTNFNISILVTDGFMAAVREDEDWYLHHPAKPSFDRAPGLSMNDFTDDDGVEQFVYSVWKARDLWDMILKSTYEYSEPGVIFIDQVNDRNNLNWIEEISCTNPCGEQPLPPHGACNLGATQLSRMVTDPFGVDAEFNWELLKASAKVGMRFLDNVIDVTRYPLAEQEKEQILKRRTGLGIGGLCDAMHFLGMRYGSPRSIDFTEKVMRMQAIAAYEESIELAKEKGPAPVMDEPGAKDKYLATPFLKQMPEHIREGVYEHGIRNPVALTIAPTGTTSIAWGNSSSGLEPVFSHVQRRKVRQADETFLGYDEVAYGARLWLSLNPGRTILDLPSHMNECADVRIHEHVRIQEVSQRWVDASISKTINLPEDIDYESFKDVYELAYDSGCKGCTTYRPSDIRGSILEVGGGSQPAGERADEGVNITPVTRPDVLTSETLKVRWPGLSSAVYLTVGYNGGQPYEVFINSKDQKSLEWTMALTILMSMALRQGIPLTQICGEFKQVQALEGGWADDPENPGKQKYWPSVIAYIGAKLEWLIAQSRAIYATPEGLIQAVAPQATEHSLVADKFTVVLNKRQCPVCRQHALINQAGCDTCTECGYSKCG